MTPISAKVYLSDILDFIANMYSKDDSKDRDSMLQSAARDQVLDNLYEKISKLKWLYYDVDQEEGSIRNCLDLLDIISMYTNYGNDKKTLKNFVTFLEERIDEQTTTVDKLRERILQEWADSEGH